jgi:hypothetical protein
MAKITRAETFKTVRTAGNGVVQGHAFGGTGAGEVVFGESNLM